MARGGWLGVVVLLLGGCASMSKDECLTADWRLIGFEDGSRGHSRNQIGEHRRDCASHGVVPDKNAYDLGYDEGILAFCSYARGLRAGQYGETLLDACPSHTEYHAGYEEGIVSFCSFDRGFEEGVAGKGYGRVCPRDLEPAFLAGHQQGLQIHDLRTTQASLQQQLKAVQTRERETEETIKETLHQIAYGDLTPEERARQLIEVDKLREESKALALERGSLQEKLDELRVRLAELGFE